MKPSKLSGWTNRLIDWITHLVMGLFDTQREKGQRWFSWLFLAVLFAGGAFCWFYFFQYSRVTFMAHDWNQITGPRLAILQDALTRGVWPLHTNDVRTLHYASDRYLVIPDIFFSPQALLLRYLSLGQFVTVDMLLMYSLGCAGLLWLKRRFSLSLFTFAVLFLLFNFNGHILSHLGIGHFTWGGYFLFPWLAGLIFQLLEGERSWAWVAKVALVLFAILLQGAYHQFIWALIFLGLLGFFNWKLFIPVLKAGLFSGLLAAVRLLPPVLAYQDFKSYYYIGGYPSLAVLWQALIDPFSSVGRLKVADMPYAMGYWEISLYVGLAGAVFLLFFGIYRWLASRPGDAPAYRGLVLPLAGMALLSMEKIYYAVRLLPVPLLTGERVASRIIIIPFTFVLILACLAFQRWLDTRRSSPALVLYLGLAGGFFFELNDLLGNLRTWTVYQVTQNAPLQLDFSPSVHHIANHSDPVYVTVLLLGAGLSLVTLLGMGLLVLREKRAKQPVISSQPAA